MGEMKYHGDGSGRAKEEKVEEEISPVHVGEEVQSMTWKNGQTRTAMVMGIVVRVVMGKWEGTWRPTSSDEGARNLHEVEKDRDRLDERWTDMEILRERQND